MTCLSYALRHERDDNAITSANAVWELQATSEQTVMQIFRTAAAYRPILQKGLPNAVLLNRALQRDQHKSFLESKTDKMTSEEL